MARLPKKDIDWDLKKRLKELRRDKKRFSHRNRARDSKDYEEVKLDVFNGSSRNS